MNPALILRADAGGRMGNGHLMRSLALAQAWQSLGGRSILITRMVPQALPSGVRTGGVELVSINACHPDPADAQFVEHLVREFNDAWVCCDGYHFDADYTHALRASARGIVIVDDIADAALYSADVIVNQNIFAERLRYSCDRETIKLLGPRYALLRREFLAWKDWHRQIVDRAKHVLVSMGGSDPDNQTYKVMRALRRPEFSTLEVKVIVGSNNTHLQVLEKEAALANGARIELLQNPPDLPALMAWADLAISAGGSTCWELCFMGVPSILITLADNQTGITAGLAEAQAAVHLGPFRAVNEDLLVRAAGELVHSQVERQRLSLNARVLVDGGGATRVCRTLLGEPEGTWDREVFVSRQ
jgi:UDP-2,4-diacetamido-2,4,6-trideoxy-beta-L-altropyranose hydrolase